MVRPGMEIFEASAKTGEGIEKSATTEPEALATDNTDQHIVAKTDHPLAYFITFTTYGTWLHGRNPGSVDRQHNQVGTPLLAADAKQEATRRRITCQEEYRLDGARREAVLKTIREVASHR